MDVFALNQLVIDLLVVLGAGFLSGAICKKLGISMLVGYLIVGACIGPGGLGFVSQEHNELEYLAHAGALLLLFSVGIEFSLDELLRMSRYFLIGGAVQMTLVAIPLGFIAAAFGLGWKSALLAGAAGALSSTVLVFKALAEWGQSATPHGRRAIGILLFQDVALVPLMLLLPLLTGVGEEPLVGAFGLLLAKSTLFVCAIALARFCVGRWLVPMLGQLKSLELVVLFTLAVLGAVCWGAQQLGLPSAVGALAVGLMLSGNRLSTQIDTLILPYRESFAAVFFVTLGTLLQPLKFFDEPFLLASGLVGMLLLKSAAATIALRLVGLNWKAAMGMGMGLAQLGEFSFLLVAEGVGQGLLTPLEYNRMLFIALGTLILTPQLLKYGLRWTSPDSQESPQPPQQFHVDEKVQRAMVIGIGPIGRQITSRMELAGVDVCLIDLSPINLHPFAQQGFHTVSGDARDPSVLRRARVFESRLAVVCVPDDESASQVVRSLRELNPTMSILVRCRFLANISAVLSSGANVVISEEQEASGALLRQCEVVLKQSEMSQAADRVLLPRGSDSPG